MQRIYDWLIGHASIKFLFFWIPVYVLYFGFAMLPYADAYLPNDKTPVVDLIQLLNEEKLITTISSYGENGRVIYAEGWIYDTIYPIIYVVLFIVILSLLFRARRIEFKNGKWWLILPVFTMAVDYCENFFFITLMKTFPETDALHVNLALFFNWLKWGSLYLIVLKIIMTLLQRKRPQIAA